MRALLFTVLLSACSKGSVDVPGDDTDTDVPADESAAAYDPDHVVEVAITIDPADWDALRAQERSLWDMLEGEDCLDAPWPNPYTEFPATVTLDGETFDDVAVRKKGFIGSNSHTRPGLKLHLDRTVAGAKWHDLDELTLNNAAQDPSVIRQCLGYEIARDGGVPAPRCDFAHVTVDGEDLGVYVNVEAAHPASLARDLGDGSGDLWEGSVSDFRDGWTATFDPKGDTDGTSALDDVAGVLATSSDDDLEADLDPLVDTDEFLRFWAWEGLVGEWDGYSSNTNNFLVYSNPADGGRLVFLPWGADGVLGNGDAPFGAGLPVSYSANGALAWRWWRHPGGTDEYRAAMDELLATWDEDALDAEIDRMDALVSPLLNQEQEDLGYDAGIAQVRDFVDGRKDDVEQELAKPPAWSADLRGSPCLVEVGSLSARFSTTWGTLATSPDPFSEGTADLTLVLQGTTYPIVAQGAIAGVIDPNGAYPDAIAVAAALSSDTYVVPIVEMLPDQVAPGTVTFDGDQAWLYYADPSTGGNLVLAAFLSGKVDLDAAGTNDGDVVSGKISAAVWGAGW